MAHTRFTTMPALMLAETPAPSEPADSLSSQASRRSSGTMACEELAWCQRIQAGDHQAAELLINKHGERLHAAFLYMCNGNADQAAELTQEAWSHACSRLQHFDGSCQFYTWLYRVARNRALDMLRRKRPTAVDPATITHSDSHHRPEHELQRREQQALVQQALGQLNDKQREIILLRDFDGLDYADIASALELTLGTVKSRLNRARGALRDHILALAGSEEAL